MHKKPLISVVVYVNNSAEYLRKCLNTLIFQMYENIEIVCIDNGSDDGSLDILEEYKQKDNRVSVYKQNGSGSGSARNLGISLSKGEYIHFIDAEDWVLLDLYNIFVNIPLEDVDIFVFNSSLYSKDFIDVPYYEAFGEEDIVNDSFDTVHTFRDMKNILTKDIRVRSKIYNKQFLNKNTIYFTEDNNYNEHLFNIQTLTKAEKIIINSEVYLRYRSCHIAENAYTEKVFDIFAMGNIMQHFLVKTDLFKYYPFAFFNYLCNSFSLYYDFCSDEDKRHYFDTMRSALLSRFDFMPPQMQNVFMNIEEAKFMLTSTFEEYNERNKKSSLVREDIGGC